MGIKDTYSIKEISYSTAMDVVVREHYLHRKCPCSFSWGIYHNDSGELFGVIVYGTPSSAPLRKGICGIEESSNVIELTRLWTRDDSPKNMESYLIGNTIKYIDKEIVVSYAEIEQGHVGTVYQATNWIYTGLSAKRTNWTIEGIDKHCQTIADKHSAKELREIYGDRFKLVPRPRKHRYVYINARGKRRRQLLAKLKYPISSYPKKV